MRSLRKISPSPYADSTHSVMAYSGDGDKGLEFEIAEPDTTSPDSTSVEPQIPTDVDPRQAAIDEAHYEAAESVLLYSAAVAGGVYANNRNWRSALAAGGVMAVARTYTSCYRSCHDQSPPRAPEIETGEEEEEEKKKDK